MKKVAIIIIVLLSMQGLFAQNGVIKGRVLNEKGEPIPFANISVKYGSQLIGTQSDFEGYYTIKPLNSGTYNVEISYMGYNKTIIQGVQVSTDNIAFMDDARLSKSRVGLPEVTVIAPRVKPIDPNDVSKMTVLPAQLEKMSDNRNIGSALRNLNPEISVSEDNSKVIIRGSRPGESMCIIDGVKQRDFSNTIPGPAIGRMTMYTGGIPAKYGDITGGVVILETKSYFDIYNAYRADQMAKESEKPLEETEAIDTKTENSDEDSKEDESTKDSSDE